MFISTAGHAQGTDSSSSQDIVYPQNLHSAIVNTHQSNSISGGEFEFDMGYGEYNTRILQNWARRIGYPIGGIPQFVLGFDMMGIYKNFAFGYTLLGAWDFKTSTGPAYISTGIDLGYAAHLFKHFIIVPQAGIYVTRTEISFGKSRPQMFQSVQDVPDDQEAILYQDGFGLSPSINVFYIWPRCKYFFIHLKANSMLNFKEYTWHYGYIKGSGKYSEDMTSPVYNMNVNSYNSSWNILLGIGLGEIFHN